MKFSTIVALLYGITFASNDQGISVRAEATQPPLQTRMSTNLWRKIFAVRD